MVSHTVALLKAPNYGEWLPLRERGELAGNLGPYSVDELERHGFQVRYSDATFERPWTGTPVGRGLGWLGRRRPELLGSHNLLANRALVRKCDLTLGIFEDQGSFAAFARGSHLWGLAPRRMALIVCWMAERALRADESTLRGYRRVLRGADLVVFFSRNQAAIFHELLGVEPERMLAVPFGIDEQFFASVPAREEGYVLAVGGDWSRDHELLVRAVAGTAIATRIQAPKLDVAELPPNVTWSAEVIDHRSYRDLLAGAQLVVVPTIATAYPGGQTVLLEAMAAGKAVITTRSEAIVDYVEDGRTGLLVPRDDAPALQAAIRRLLDDTALRASIEREAQREVRRTFNQAAMWATIAQSLQRMLASGAHARLGAPRRRQEVQSR